MKRFALMFLLVLFPFVTSHAQELFSSYAPLNGNVALETALLQKTNAERQAHGVAALEYSDALALAARTHAAEMASLGYFSHSSPSDGSRTPPERAANAAFPFLVVGENIARMPSDNVAVDTTRGWMDSPGHRENLLLPDFTHVGFGTAVDARGQTVVVQMFGKQPYRLVSAQLTPKQISEYSVTLELDTPQGGNFVIYYGEQVTEPMSLSAGRHQIPLELSQAQTGQLHVQLGVMSPNGEGFIFQDAGWLALESNTYLADEIAPKTYGHIVGAQASLQALDVHEVQLSFDGATDKQLAVFVDDDYLPQAVVSPGVVKVSVPATATEPEIVVGERSGASSVNVNMMLTIDQVQGRPVLAVKPAQ